ncbi:hypothetical protein BHM03_00004931 [Ensete ventricosum]|nr:hypothetical protein BHM03_00004931 [Ensete ventricosum]
MMDLVPKQRWRSQRACIRGLISHCYEARRTFAAFAAGLATACAAVETGATSPSLLPLQPPVLVDHLPPPQSAQATLTCRRIILYWDRRISHVCYLRHLRPSVVLWKSSASGRLPGNGLRSHRLAVR